MKLFCREIKATWGWHKWMTWDIKRRAKSAIKFESFEIFLVHNSIVHVRRVHNFFIVQVPSICLQKCFRSKCREFSFFNQIKEREVSVCDANRRATLRSKDENFFMTRKFFGTIFSHWKTENSRERILVGALKKQNCIKNPEAWCTALNDSYGNDVIQCSHKRLFMSV